MVAILIQTVPVIPSEVQSTVPEIHEQMINYMQSIYDQLNKQLRNRSQFLIESNPGITRYRALSIFVQQSFKAELYSFDPNYRAPPTLKKQVIMQMYENWPSMASREPAELM